MMGTETAAKPSQTYDLGLVEQISIGEGRLLRIGHVPVAVFRARWRPGAWWAPPWRQPGSRTIRRGVCRQGMPSILA